MRAIRKVKPVKLRDASAIIIQANAAHLPLPNNSVDLIVTSPPYFALRSYTDAGEHYAGQIGSEATPQEFLEALWTCTREWMRVLKPTGSLWVNLGDVYSSKTKGSGGTGRSTLGSASGGHAISDEALLKSQRRSQHGGYRVDMGGVRTKSLVGLPWRYALGCIDQLGLILRAEIIWEKPNGLPESVKDRVRRSHEQWFHFVLQPKYFTAIDEIREPHADVSLARAGRNRFAPDLSQRGVGAPNTLDPTQACNFLGKLPGSVWNVPTEPLRIPEHLNIKHFAAFPSEFPRRIILGWSPSGICVECEQPRRPEVDKARRNTRPVVISHALHAAHQDDDRRSFTRGETDATITGYACACPTPDAPTRPSIVLDPLGGTGTTAGVAFALGRTGISVDLSHDYGRLARWRACDDYTLRNKVWKKSPVYRPSTTQEGVA